MMTLLTKCYNRGAISSVCHQCIRGVLVITSVWYNNTPVITGTALLGYIDITPSVVLAYGIYFTLVGSFSKGTGQ